jgi:hypothetical protein
MSQPIQAPQPYYPQIDKNVQPQVTVHLQRIYPALNDLNQAIITLKSQLNEATTTTTSAATTTTASTATQTTSTVTKFIGLGTVNNQTGATSYTVQTSDNGILLFIDDASAVSISLNSMVGSPYLVFITNFGAGTATLTPTSGTINGGASYTLAQNYTCLAVFDGTNWWATALLIEPQNTPAVAHEWLASYNSSTGAFTQTQPAFSDISGTVAASQLPTPTASTLGGVESAGPTTHEWINEIDTSGVPHLSQPTSADVVPASGTTGSRPSVHATGQPYFDTTLGIPIWWSGSTWVNATGASV